MIISTYEKIQVDEENTYEVLVESLRALLVSDDDPVSQLANASALIMDTLNELNWVGFYRYKDSQLVLGPFQGKPACTRISLDRGVCGAAARLKKTMRIDDVHAFPGHIACDHASRSEIVLPLLSKNGVLLGVLDLDSPRLSRFSQRDEEGLSSVARLLEEIVHWPV